MMFPLWFLQILVIGALLLCGAGAITLLIFLWLDSRDKQVW